MKKIIQQILRLMPTLFWVAMLVVTYLLLANLAPPNIKVEYVDKLEHAFVFMGLTCMALIAWPQRKRLVFIGLTIFGGAMELAQQAFASYRQATLGDWAADIVGILIALIIFHVLAKRRSKLG
jgi:VanZ family protein